MASGLRLCRLCKVKPVSEARAKWSDFRCNPCRNASPATLAAKARYVETPRGKAISDARNQRTNARRIWIGGRYHSAAATAELAQKINAHIKDRLNEPFARQSAGKKTQGV
jgi:hypothetical protein